jgi:hypothetical protein
LARSIWSNTERGAAEVGCKFHTTTPHLLVERGVFNNNELGQSAFHLEDVMCKKLRSSLILLCFALFIPTIVSAQSVPLMDTSQLGRFTFSATKTQRSGSSELSSPWVSQKQMLISKGGSTFDARSLFDPSRDDQNEFIPGIRNNRHAFGLVYRDNDLVLTVEYSRRGYESSIYRGPFAGKFFAGVQYKFGESASFFAGASNNFSAGLFFGDNTQGTTISFVSRPTGKQRDLFALENNKGSFASITHHWKF